MLIRRHYAEYAGYWETTSFLKDHTMASVLENGEITFYDSNTGDPLFYAPRGRTFDEFVSESKKHGWPSFRDEEVIGLHRLDDISEIFALVRNKLGG